DFPAEGAPCLRKYSKPSVIFNQFIIVEVRVPFNLVRGRCHPSLINEFLQMFRQEVGYTYRFYKTKFLCVYQSLPSFHVFSLLRQRPVNQILVEIVDADTVKGFL